jgi:crotonobetainyl-CoA:carnitine CoA-transferase CaiB-like acyl-CoA transferase
MAEQHALPIGPVHGFDEALVEPTFAAAGLTEATPMPDGRAAPGVGPWLAGVSQTPARAAPKLGEHTEAILAEFGIQN